MHLLNDLLPPTERARVEADAEQSLAEILEQVTSIQDKFNSLESFLKEAKSSGKESGYETLEERWDEIAEMEKTIVRCTGRLSAHKQLQYTLDVKTRTTIATLFTAIYECKQLRPAFKVQLRKRLLNTIKSMRKKSEVYMEDFKFDWRVVWEDIMDILSRIGRHEPLTSELNLSDYLGLLVGFLHSSRGYIKTDIVGSPTCIVEMAMTQLQDTRLQTCIEGVLLLVNCLPTDFAHYDRYLPLWIEIWATVESNVFWDCCWLTLLCRARKHTVSFDWKFLYSLLLCKTRQLLQVPAAPNSLVFPEGSDFPRGAPLQYSKLLVITADTRKVALNKIAKLLYFTSIIAPTDTVPTTISVTPQSKMTVSGDGANTNPDLIDPFAIPNEYEKEAVSALSVELVLFFQSLRPFFFPSNTGAWTHSLAYFITTIVMQLCKHTSRSIAATVFKDEFLFGLAPACPLRHKVRAADLRYVCRSLLPLLMEGLYGKDQFTIQFCCSCLKNLVTLDCNLGEVLIPFLMSSLDPSAVNQSHQAPVAMSTISICFKALLYPQPVIVKYLPTLLRLSLPGIDANDQKKTQNTLSMYSSILGWLPLQSAYTAWAPDAVPPTYVTLLEHMGSSGQRGLSFSQEGLQVELDTLAAYLVEWIPAALDKLFLLLEAQEEQKKGTKEGPIVAAVGQFAGFLFQALPLEDPLRLAAEEKIISYFLRGSPVHGAKMAARVIESITGTRPAVLPSLLAKVLDADVLSNSCATEKLVFRIRIAGGAVRGATGAFVLQEESLALLRAVVTSNTFLLHTEKSVRKVTYKLVKDIFKGATAVYPLDVTPSIPQGSCLGAPSAMGSGSVQWHVPSAADLSTAVGLLKATASEAMLKVRAILDAAQAESGTSTVDVTQAKDIIVCSFNLIGRALRGAAEILGDDFSAASIQSEGEGKASTEGILYTCRNEAFASLSAGDAKYLNEFRSEVLRLLSDCYSTLEGVPAGAPYASLRDSPDINKKWMKVLTIVTGQRMACLKHVDNVKQWVVYTKRMSRSSISKAMHQLIKYREKRGMPAVTVACPGLPPKWAEEFANNLYWRAHDMNTNLISNMAWLQHATRQKQLARSSFFLNVSEQDPSDPYMRCLGHLIHLGQHEFDGIRAKAHHTFDKVSLQYSSKLKSTITALLGSLTIVGNTYPKAAGQIAILKTPRLIKKIIMNNEHSALFLQGMLASQSMVSSVVAEQEKKEIVLTKLSTLFVKYMNGFSLDERNSKASLLTTVQTALTNAGYTTDSSVSSSVSSMVVETADVEVVIDGSTTGSSTLAAGSSSSTAVATTGLRFQTFSAFTALLFIGHRGVDISPALWKWTLTTVCKAHGQPTQVIALTALSRLSYLATLHGVTPEVSAAVTPLLTPTSPTSAWTLLLKGVSQCHPKESDDGSSAQWSHGIDHLLRFASYLKIVHPRDSTSGGPNSFRNRNSFSQHFNKEGGQMLYSMILSGLMGDIFSSTAALEALIAVANTLPSTGEAEDRSNNATRAELFGGLLRAFYATSTKREASATAAIYPILVQFLSENIEKVSLDFSNDWFEAMLFGLTDNGMEIQEDPITKYAIECFEQSIDSQAKDAKKQTGAGGGAGAKEVSTTTASEDGFAKHASTIAMARALIIAEISSKGSHRDFKQGWVSKKLIDISTVANGNIVSPHLPCRRGLSALFALVFDAALSAESVDVTQLFANLTAASLKDGSTAMTTEVESNASNGAVSEEKSENLHTKNAVQMSVYWLRFLLDRCPLSRCQEAVLVLLPLALAGSGNADIVVAKLSHETCLLAAGALHCTDVLDGSTSSIEQKMLTILDAHTTHASWHVRQTVMLCLTALMVNCWYRLSNDDKKLCKDAFSKGLNDLKPEVVELAKAGIISYLSLKPAHELVAIAAAFTKNSDTFADRNRRQAKLKASSSSSSSAAAVEKIDPQYKTTIVMMSCLILATPFDLPSYLPVMLTSFVRHTTSSSSQLRDVVVKTIQYFKTTHQDRWESEFSHMFTREQLQDLQGAGAAHYFS